MISRPHINSCVNNSLAIRQEIQRFESVHPSIYAIYDLIELIPDPIVAQQIRDNVVCIEDSFVNSQEWTVSRCVPDLRLGIVGNVSSGKSALVHRYLTGTYMQEESPEGGRFKKEVLMDGHSYLLLIRDEGGPPELQFSSWVDAVIFVFSLENEASFNAVYSFYAKMTNYRNAAEVPLILVGTQDAISESNPRVIDDARARKLANDLKRCTYYETCATYGLNVERVFQDACQKIMQQRMSQSLLGSRPTTPVAPPPGLNSSPHHSNNSIQDVSKSSGGLSSSSYTLHKEVSENNNTMTVAAIAKMIPPPLDNLTLNPPPPPRDLPTPTSTPTASRKNRRRSNLFTPSKKSSSSGEERTGGKESQVGSGRAIPVKQGCLYKRSGKALNKEWKKKYVTLTDDGRITYHPSLHDYMTDVHGKEIALGRVTVKVPGQRPRGSQAPAPQTNGQHESAALTPITNYQSKDKKHADKVTLMHYEVLKESGKGHSGYDDVVVSGNHSIVNGTSDMKDTPNVKKRHRRVKSSSVKNGDADECDGYEFHIVSLDNKQWHFEAATYEEREEWLAAIQNQILNSLQGVESSKGKLRLNSTVEAASLASIRTDVPGNGVCADCSEPGPDWASLNLGILVCIECSGIHRNLGSHISKVRSLHLDEWPPGHLAVMLSIGNRLANSVWEANEGDGKPSPGAARTDKERWAQLKYVSKTMLRSAPTEPGHWRAQLIDATCRSDMRGVVEALVHGDNSTVNATVSPTDRRTALYLACAMGNLPIAQLLLWYNADVTVTDTDGSTVLDAAMAAASRGQSEESNIAHNLVQLLATLLPAAPTLPVPSSTTATLDSLPASVI